MKHSALPKLRSTPEVLTFYFDIIATATVLAKEQKSNSCLRCTVVQVTRGYIHEVGTRNSILRFKGSRTIMWCSNSPVQDIVGMLASHVDL